MRLFLNINPNFHLPIFIMRTISCLNFPNNYILLDNLQNSFLSVVFVSCSFVSPIYVSILVIYVLNWSLKSR